MNAREYEGQLIRLECGRKSMKVGLLRITPEMAMDWLQDSKNFRRMNVLRVVRYRSALKHGSWELNGDTIKINRQGKCIDGRHRLQACILEKKPFISLVAFDVDSVVETDRGMNRTLSQELESRGYQYSSALATTLIYLWASIEAGGENPGTISSKKVVACTSDMLETLKKYEEILVPLMPVAFRTIRMVSSNIMGSTLAMIMVHGGYDLEKVTDFIDGMCDEDLKMADPRRVLRERLRTNKAAKAKLGQLDLRALIIKTWNAYIQGRSMAKNSLRWDAVREDFPEIVKITEL